MILPLVERLLSDSSQSLLELVHATACIDKLLLAGVEGVALGADFNLHLATLGRARDDSLAAGALDDALNVLGICFLLLFFSQLFVRPPQTAILLFCISFLWEWS